MRGIAAAVLLAAVGATAPVLGQEAVKAGVVVHRLQAHAAVTEQGSRGEGEVDLGEHIGREDFVRAALPIGAARRRTRFDGLRLEAGAESSQFALPLRLQPGLQLAQAGVPGLLHTVKPVKSLADLKGKKIRSTGLSAKVISALGGVPVAMPQGSTYESLQKGVVEGTVGPIEVLKGWKQAEVIKNTTECRDVGYTTAMFVVMNKAKWDSISPADQKAIEKINDEYNEKIAKRWVELDKAAKEYSLGKGVTFVAVSEKEQAATAEKMKPIWDTYVNMAKSKGLPGDEALKFCLDYIKSHP